MPKVKVWAGLQSPKAQGEDRSCVFQLLIAADVPGWQPHRSHLRPCGHMASSLLWASPVCLKVPSGFL